MVKISRLKDATHSTRKPRFILPAEGKNFSLDCKETQLANNVAIFGGTGSKKTRSNIRPNIEELFGNYILLDPKGALYREYGKWFENNGYKVYRYDFTQPFKSNHYNPFAAPFLNSTDDIMALSHMIVNSDRVDGGSHEDPFWREANQILLAEKIGEILENDKIPKEKKNFSTLTDQLIKMNQDYNKGLFRPDFFEETEQFKTLEEIDAKHKGNSWVVRQFMKLRTIPDKTMNTVFITAHAKLATLDTEGLNYLMSSNDLDIKDLAEKKTAVFVITSDIDRSKDLLTNIFFSQVIRALCEYADHNCKNGSLPRMVRFFLDDFGTSVKIDQFPHFISNIRARNIACVTSQQSIGQLKASYGEDYNTILANADTKIYMGGSDVATAEYFAHLCNLPTPSVLNLPLNHNIIARRGEGYSINKTQDLLDYREYYKPESYEDVVCVKDALAG